MKNCRVWWLRCVILRSRFS